MPAGSRAAASICAWSAAASSLVLGLTSKILRCLFGGVGENERSGRRHRIPSDEVCADVPDPEVASAAVYLDRARPRIGVANELSSFGVAGMDGPL